MILRRNFTSIFKIIPLIRSVFVSPLLLSLLLVTGCSGMVPTMPEIKKDNADSRSAQMLRIANTTRQGGDLASALSLYRRAHAMAPEDLAPLIAIGEVAYGLGEYEQSANAYDQAASRAPDNAQVQLGYGKTLISMDQPEKAIDHYQKAIAINPGDHRGYNGYGVALDMLGRHEEAQSQYTKGLSQAPDAVSLSNNLALSMAFDGHYEQAIQILNVLADDPLSTPRLRQNMALIYGLAGLEDKAAMMASKDLDPQGVENNLAYYRQLRDLSSKDRAHAVFGSPKKVTP